MLTLENDLVPFTNNHRSRNLRISQSAVFSVVPKSADCEGLVYIFVWASKSMLPFHLHLSPQTLSFLQKHFSSQKGMYSDRSGWLWVRILPHLPSVWVTPIWYRNLIVVAPPSLSKSMFCRRMWQKNGSLLSYPQIHSYMYINLQCLVSKRWQNSRSCIIEKSCIWMDYFERHCMPSMVNNLRNKHLNLQNKNAAPCKRISTHVCILSV